MDVGAKPALLALVLLVAVCPIAATVVHGIGRARQGVLRSELNPPRQQDAAPATLLEVKADGTQVSIAEEALVSGILLQTLSLNTEIHAVAFSPGGTEVATGSADNAVTVWSAGTGVSLRNLYHHKGKVHSINYSPDGEMLLTGGTDDAIIWSAEAAEIEEEFNETGPINQAAFSRDCMHIITASENNMSQVWETRTKHLKCKLRGHTAQIDAVAMNPEGGTAITGSHDFTARIWDVEACLAQSGFGKQNGYVTNVQDSKSILSGHTGAVFAVAFSPYGTWVVTGSEDYTARIWDAANGTSLHVFGMSGGGHLGPVRSIAWKPRPKGVTSWKPEHDLVVTGSDDGTAKLWYAHTGMLMKTFNHGGKVMSVAWGPDGDRILTGSTDGTAKIWTVDSSRMGTLMRGYLISPTAPQPLDTP